MKDKANNPQSFVKMEEARRLMDQGHYQESLILALNALLQELDYLRSSLLALETVTRSEFSPASLQAGEEHPPPTLAGCRQSNRGSCIEGRFSFVVGQPWSKSVPKSFWWHRHLAGAAHRLEACATKGGGHGGPPHRPIHDLRVSRRLMFNCLEKFQVQSQGYDHHELFIQYGRAKGTGGTAPSLYRKNTVVIAREDRKG